MPKRTWIFGLLACVIVAQGCTPPPPTRIKFNDRIASDVRKLNALGMAFRKPLASLLDTNEPSLPPDAAATMSAKAAEIKTEVAAMLAAADSMQLTRTPTPTAEPYKKAYQDFLAVESKIANEYLDQIVAVAGSGKSNIAKRDEIRSLLRNKVEAAENAPRQCFSGARPILV